MFGRRIMVFITSAAPLCEVLFLFPQGKRASPEGYDGFAPRDWGSRYWVSISRKYFFGTVPPVIGVLTRTVTTSVKPSARPGPPTCSICDCVRSQLTKSSDTATTGVLPVQPRSL